LTSGHELTVRRATAGDRAWIESFLEDRGWTLVARRNELVRALDHPMLMALDGNEPAGFLTYLLGADACEVLTLNAVRPWHGAGTALLSAVAVIARDAGCTRLWLVTTNDNVDALRFYQRRGYRLRTLWPGAIDRARRDLKPELPEIGDHGIPIRDELELELDLTAV
jgi:ribosomal protein S18 acetylase RimI-like enzyme